jgi:metal-responsive CopG/Arc/MetJ family transcriptional regulator
MSRTFSERRRMKVSVTVDPTLLQAIDAYVEEHPETDRSKVVDEALALWYARQQERAMQEQFAESPSRAELTERAAWRDVRRGAAVRALGRPEPE